MKLVGYSEDDTEGSWGLVLSYTFDEMPLWRWTITIHFPEVDDSIWIGCFDVTLFNHGPVFDDEGYLFSPLIPFILLWAEEDDPYRTFYTPLEWKAIRGSGKESDREA